MSDISLCMITKDNESTLYKALDSVKDLVDEIIIVDTGSSDKTIAIARTFRAIIYETSWENDFSKCRNLYLEKASKSWILVLDSDEYLDENSIDTIKEVISLSNNYKAYTLRITNLHHSEELNNTGPALRLFINSSNIRYEHRVHEQVCWSLIDNYGEKCISSIDATIYHTGYNISNDDMKKKIKRNFDILNSYNDKEKDDYYNYLLGRHYFDEYNYKNALIFFEKALENPNKVIGQIAYIRLARVFCLINFREFNIAIEEINSMKLEYTKFKDLYYTEYLLFRCYGYINEAINSLITYSKTINDDILYPTIYYVTDNIVIDNLNQLKIFLNN